MATTVMPNSAFESDCNVGFIIRLVESTGNTSVVHMDTRSKSRHVSSLTPSYLEERVKLLFLLEHLHIQEELQPMVHRLVVLRQ